MKDSTKFKQVRRLKSTVWERDNYTCQYCGLDMKSLYFDYLAKKIKRKFALITADHVIPRSKGGLWVEENLVTCCAPCNLKKKNNEIKFPIPTRRQKIVYRLLEVLVMWGEWAKKRRIRNPSHLWKNIG